MFRRYFKIPFKLFYVLFVFTPGAYAAGTPAAKTVKSAKIETSVATAAADFQMPSGMSNIFAACPRVNQPQCSLSIPEAAPGAVKNCTMSMPMISQSVSQQLFIVDQVSANLTCKAQAVTAMRSEISCVSSAAQSLANGIGSLQGVYNENIHAMEQSVQKLQNMERDMDAKVEDIDRKLKGENNDGLVKQLDDANKVMAEMPKEVQNIKERYNDVDRKKQGLEESVKMRKTALAVQCFNTDKSPAYISEKGGEAGSALQYAVAMYRNKLREGAGGVIEESEFRKKDAEAKAKQLEAALAQWFSKLPNNPELGLTSGGSNGNASGGGANGAAGGQDDLTKFLGQNRTLITPDLIKSLEESLKPYDGNGMSISEFVGATMRKCYDDNSAKVEGERSSRSTQIGRYQDDVKVAERDTKKEVSLLLDKYTGVMQDSMSKLTGQNLPIDTANCTAPNQSPAGQMKCLDDAYKNMKGLVEGSLPQAVVNMFIKGNDPATSIGFQCAGLKGCVQKLKNYSTDVKAAKQQVTQSKKAYVLSSNQAIESFTKRIAAQISPQMAMLNQRIDFLNLIMGGLGVKSLVERQLVTPEKLAPNGNADSKEINGMDGLFKAPDSILNLIGGMMSPPMLDVSKNLFNTVITGIAERLSEISKAQAEVQKVRAELGNILSECQAEKFKEAKEAAKEAREEARSNQGQDQLQGIQGILGALTGGKLGEQSGASAAGVDRDCDTMTDQIIGGLAGSSKIVGMSSEEVRDYAKRLATGRGCVGESAQISPALTKGMNDDTKILTGGSAGSVK